MAPRRSVLVCAFLEIKIVTARLLALGLVIGVLTASAPANIVYMGIDPSLHQVFAEASKPVNGECGVGCQSGVQTDSGGAASANSRSQT